MVSQWYEAEGTEMAKINVVDLGGKHVGELELADEVFGAEVNETLLWEAVKHYRASLRQGTAATKNKKLVSGSGKKLWKQKGTGRARVGSVRSPIWRPLGFELHGLVGIHPKTVSVVPELNLKFERFSVSCGTLWLDGEAFSLGAHFRRNIESYGKLKLLF